MKKADSISFTLKENTLGVTGKMEFKDGIYWLLKGSQVRDEETPSLKIYHDDIYQSRKFIKKHLLDNKGRLRVNIPYTSATTASGVLLGHCSNGFTEWVTENNVTLGSYVNA